MTGDMHRRAFLKSTVLAGAGLAASGVTGQAKGQSKLKRRGSPNEKLNIAIIGVGHRGQANTNGVKSENIVALCDVDQRFVDQGKKRFPKAQGYKDWRKAIEQKDVDAVVCSTTDHTHAFVAVAAMELGKHVYCEKPLGHSVWEAKRVRDTYLKHKDKVATQQGTQIHATENYRRVVELVQGGSLGKVTEAHVWCARVGPGGTWPKQTDPVPSYFDWDLWCGPAPKRNFSQKVLDLDGKWNCLSWNCYWDYGQGTIGDMGSHLIDLPFWALDLDYPTSVEAKGTPVHPVTCPQWMIASYEHPAKGNRGPIKLVWYDADKRPKNPAGIDLSKWGIGVMFVGERGKLVADYGKHYFLPNKDYRDFEPPTMKIPSSPGHYKEWINACKTGSPTLCNFDYAGKLIQNNLLANVAYRTGEKIKWDHKNLKAVGCSKADEFIHREYRKGWTI